MPSQRVPAFGAGPDSAAAYDAAVTELFRCLDKAEDMLGATRYMSGDRFTEADVRLFPTLVRRRPLSTSFNFNTFANPGFLSQTPPA